MGLCYGRRWRRRVGEMVGRVVLERVGVEDRWILGDRILCQTFNINFCRAV